MVGFLSLSLLSLLAGSAFSVIVPEQEVILDTPARTMEGWSYTDCGLPTDVVQIKSISVFPDPPKPGKNLTLTAVGTVNQVVEVGAFADVTVKLGLIKLLHKQFDICHEASAANASIQCPVDTGDYTVVQTVALPNEIPRAKFSINVRGYTVDEEDLLCLDLKVDFMQSPFYRIF
ncbi:ML domain-containing protein [Pisolithus croceorrhizus]|nr:ML domain-containing protein [Pisolithus croceorrhizus]KAI6133129.1 ML domain-containing protein [Pisolithus croceorrhizus]KAI6136705.1 ML domain-containing protein [Pisolithus sp. B1]